MPQGNPPPPSVQPEVINLDIDFDGTMTWNGNDVPDRATLKSYLISSADKDPQPELHIHPNKLVKYSYVAEVLAEAQHLGLVKIGFVGNEQLAE
jgi:biopolymer transport protein ExbD